MKLAGVVITKNEELNIGRCLNSLKFCDEIVVLDSGSTDATLTIARRYTEKVYTSAWKGYSIQKNKAETVEVRADVAGIGISSVQLTMNREFSA